MMKIIGGWLVLDWILIFSQSWQSNNTGSLVSCLMEIQPRHQPRVTSVTDKGKSRFCSTNMTILPAYIVFFGVCVDMDMSMSIHT